MKNVLEEYENESLHFCAAAACLKHIQNILSRHNYLHINIMKTSEDWFRDSPSPLQHLGLTSQNGAKIDFWKKSHHHPTVMVVYVDDIHSHSISSYDHFICLCEHYSLFIYSNCLLCFKICPNTLTSHMIESGVSLPSVSLSPVPADSAGSLPTSYEWSGQLSWLAPHVVPP